MTDRARRGRRETTGNATGTRLAFVLGGVLAVVAVLVAVVWFSPLLSVRTIRVDGAVAVSEAQILDAAEVPDGRPLLRVDTDAAARRIAALPKIAQARVQRSYPSTIRITVVERTPVAFFDSPQGQQLVDAGGVVYAIEAAPPNVPRLKLDKPDPNDPKAQAALAVLAAVPTQLRDQVREVSVPSTSAITLTLRDDRVIVWGDKEHSDRKAAVALPLLSQDGKTYDVSSPDLPTVR